MKLGKTHDTPATACTACGAKVDGMTQVVDEDEEVVDVPTPSVALTICYRCGHVMAINDDFSLRDLRDDEIVDAAGDPRIVAFNNARRLSKL